MQKILAKQSRINVVDVIYKVHPERISEAKGIFEKKADPEWRDENTRRKE